MGNETQFLMDSLHRNFTMRYRAPMDYGEDILRLRPSGKWRRVVHTTEGRNANIHLSDNLTSHRRSGLLL